MKKIHALALSMFALGTCELALAAVSNLTGNGEGATLEAATAKAKENLEESCKSFKGSPVADSFKVTFDKPLSNGKHYVDATLQCDIP
ncbi:hypothetical protein BZL41_26375 [Pseudomonas sp. PIC25]|uniref:hypothetical protein n=1 Tax=Pseudomonas sp. PIC25 TaxID=1958773 RepID=UPI000BABF73C|nr:hypothetical protein [Pseudomonas sp. PIC25]PAU51960.1 hypothetical protein BZL41_26375 [Pseudomonas sp. PIC25]